MSALIRIGLAIPARLIILNVCWIALVVWAAMQGYVSFVFTHDISGISYVIAAVFSLGLVGAFCGKVELLERLEVWLVTLGLIANAVGFVIALHGVDTTALGSPDGVQRVAANLLHGMGAAFYGTLVGAVTALWTNTNHWVLRK